MVPPKRKGLEFGQLNQSYLFPSNFRDFFSHIFLMSKEVSGRLMTMEQGGGGTGIFHKYAVDFFCQQVFLLPNAVCFSRVLCLSRDCVEADQAVATI